MASLVVSTTEQTATVHAGAFQACALEAHTYGFEARVSLRVDLEDEDDTLLSVLTSTQICKAILSLANGRLILASETPTVSTFTGYVTAYSFSEETTSDIEGKPIIERDYSIVFCDPARAFWTVHRPIALYSSKSLRDVIDANLVEGVTVTYDWPRLTQTQDVLCVALGGSQRATFYDFVVGMVSELCGVLEYDRTEGCYRLAKTKAKRSTVVSLAFDCVEMLSVSGAQLHRHSTTVLNGFSEATVTRTGVANSLAATGARVDVLVRTPIAKDAESQAGSETERLRQGEHHLNSVFGRLPEAFLCPLDYCQLSDEFGPNVYAAGKMYRVIGLSFTACSDSKDDEPDPGDDCRALEMSLSCELELESEPAANLPPFELLKYPIFVEGRVLSASGTDADHTWHSAAGADGCSSRYRVHVPLWNQTVVVPFVPFGESGHFFFPAAKGQRVLLEVERDSAQIISFLDWRAKLSANTQGNQLVMGKRDESQTVLRHVYTDDSIVFTLARSQWGDQQTIELSDGRFFLEVKDEPVPKPTTETYDLSPQADVARDSASASSRSALGNMSNSYDESMRKASQTLARSKTEVEDAIAAKRETISTQASSIEEDLSNHAADLDALGEPLESQVSSAKARLAQLVEEG